MRGYSPTTITHRCVLGLGVDVINRVFGEGADQAQVFHTAVSPVVDSVLEGWRVCVRVRVRVC